MDLLLAGLLAVAAAALSPVAAEVSRPPAPLGAVGYALVTVAALALSLRRRQPLAGFAVTALCTSAYLALGYAYGPILIVFMLAAYSLFRHASLRPALWCAASSLVLLLVHLSTSDRELGWLAAGPVTAWVVVPAAIGYGLRLRAEAAERDRAEAIRQRVDDERLRVAQEVHDIVGHGLAAIKMQADIALHVLARSPGQAEVALSAISRTSGQALDELRATLAAVSARGPDLVGPALGGAGLGGPGLGGLDELRRRMAAAGVEISLHTSGAPGAQLPPAVDLAGYRVVQESLTNVLRHGGGRQAEINLRYEPGSVAITVVNPFTGPASIGTGSGIAGMRARVEALGGELTAGPVERRFEVHARIPLAVPA